MSLDAINASINTQKSERVHGDEGDAYFDCLQQAINRVIETNKHSHALADALTIVQDHVTGLRGRTLQRFFLLSNENFIVSQGITPAEYQASPFNVPDNLPNRIVIEIAKLYQACVYSELAKLKKRPPPIWLKQLLDKEVVLNQASLFNGGKKRSRKHKKSHRKKSHGKKSGKKSHRKSRRH